MTPESGWTRFGMGATRPTIADGETQANWVPLYIPPPLRDDVLVQAGPEVQAAEQQCDGMLALPEELTMDEVIQVARSDASLTAREVVLHFLEQGVNMGAWQVKAAEIAMTAGMAMLHGLGMEIRQLIASEVLRQTTIDS